MAGEIRQRDNISPKLFPTCLQDVVINKINWEKKVININREYLSHLIYTDDIKSTAQSTHELQDKEWNIVEEIKRRVAPESPSAKLIISQEVSIKRIVSTKVLYQ